MSPITSGPYQPSPAASTILLVEDNDALREVLKDTLRLLGYNVVAASSGENALEVARQTKERIALVISDLVMPGMNALQLYEALHFQPGRDKMLIITGYPMPHTGVSLVEKPGVRWASKPIGIDELQHVVSHMLSD